MTIQLKVLFILLLFAITVGAQAEPLDINSASATLLAKTMHGVGQKRAEAIVAYREQHGEFKTVDELALIRGISVNIVDANRELITANVELPPATADAATAASGGNATP